jgi:hypothetical protein
VRCLVQGRNINKCLLNSISPIAVQQELSHRRRGANGLVTHFFRTKWVTLWAQHEPAPNHKNQFFLTFRELFVTKLGTEKNWLLLLFYISPDGFNSWLLNPDNCQGNTMGNQRHNFSLTSSEAQTPFVVGLLWNSSMQSVVRDLICMWDERGCRAQKVPAFKTDNVPGWSKSSYLTFLRQEDLEVQARGARDTVIEQTDKLIFSWVSFLLCKMA